MRNDVTLQRRLSLAKPIPRNMPGRQAFLLADVIKQMWSAGSKSGYMSTLGKVPSDITNHGIIASSLEDCIVHCQAQPLCRGVAVSDELSLDNPIYQTDRDNCFFIYTDYWVSRILSFALDVFQLPYITSVARLAELCMNDEIYDLEMSWSILKLGVIIKFNIYPIHYVL